MLTALAEVLACGDFGGRVVLLLVGADDVAEAWGRLSLGVQRAIIHQVMTVTVLPAGRGRGFDPTAVRVAGSDK